LCSSGDRNMLRVTCSEEGNTWQQQLESHLL
jgi:hypothetical protein